jgi:hypothetical protein
MTKDDIIRMARDAGCLLPGKGGDPNGLWEPNGWENVTDLMFKFAALVAAHEREECIAIAESKRHSPNFVLASIPSQNGTAVDIANLIRERGKK